MKKTGNELFFDSTDPTAEVKIQKASKSHKGYSIQKRSSQEALMLQRDPIQSESHEPNSQKSSPPN